MRGETLIPNWKFLRLGMLVFCAMLSVALSSRIVLAETSSPEDTPLTSARTTEGILTLPATTSGVVSVMADLSSYELDERIAVTITNDTGVSIYALDGQTYCTIVSLQIFSDDEWKPTGDCLHEAPPFAEEIPPMTQRRVDLIRQSVVNPSLPAGVYRIEFIYTVGSENGPGHIIHSQEFTLDGIVGGGEKSGGLHTLFLPCVTK